MALAAALAVPAVQILIIGFPHAYDTRLHVLWSQAFGSQLWGGELYPRWLVGVGHGFGSPAFFFYPPLPYYVAAVLQPLLPAAGSAPLRLAFGLCVALGAAALFCFVWLRRHVGAWPAAFGAALYALAPYHVLIDVWLRGAYAEAWAFVWPPLLLAGVDRATTQPWRALLVSAAAAAGLFLSHPPTALTVPPLVAAWAAMSALTERSLAPLAVCAGGLLLGAGLAGPYLATALTHGPYVEQQHLFEGLYVYSRSFLFRAMPLTPRGWVEGGAIVMLAVCVGAALAGQRASQPLRRLGRFAGAAAAAYFFLMLPLSDPVWKLLPLLQKIQFPWRLSLELVLLASAAGAVLLAAALAARPSARRLLGVAAAGVVLALVATSVAAPPHKRLKPKRLARYLRENDNAAEHIVPHQRDPNALLPDGARVAFVKGGGEVRVETWKARRIELVFETPGPARLAVRQQLYPGWRAELSGRPLAVDALRAWGIVGVDVPAGRHRLTLTLGPTPHEREGWIVGGVSLFLLGLTLPAAKAPPRR